MSSRPLRTLASELDYRDAPPPKRWDIRGTAEILQDHKRQIPVGSPGDAIDDLSEGHRQLLEATEYHAVGTAILKKVTPDDELDYAVNMAEIPDVLRELILCLERLEVSTAGIREQIRLADGDTDLLNWVTEHAREFLDENTLDALFVADNGALDIGEIPWAPGIRVPQNEYRPPRDSYRVVERFHPSMYKEAYERRLSHLKITLGELVQYKKEQKEKKGK